MCVLSCLYDNGLQEESAAVSALIKANKDGLLKVVPSLIAHKQLKPRAALALSLLRQLEFLPERVSAYTSDKMPAELKNALQDIAQLAGPAYGELSLKAKQIIDDSLTPPFQARLDALKKELMIPGADLNKVQQPQIHKYNIYPLMMIPGADLNKVQQCKARTRSTY